jgi:beta-lactamase regulating signal transducer with metallopeptidase domain
VQALISRIIDAVSGNPLLERLLVASLELLVVTALVLAIIHIARVRSSRVIALMWLVALSKPILGLALGAPAPVFTLEKIQDAGVTSQAVSTGSVPSITGAITAPGVATGVSGDVSWFTTTKGTALPDLSSLLFGLWLAGAGLFVLLSILDRLRIQKIIADSTAPGREILALYHEAAGDSPARRLPKLRITDRLESPAIAGSFVPVIFLPAWMTHNADPNRILWSLRHELTHWRHRDTLAGFVREVSRMLFFFHPLVWWIGKQWKEASEVACDQAMVGTRRDACHYAEQLYQILTRVHSRRQIMITSGLFATRTQIGKRIELLLKNRPLARGGRPLPAAAFLLVFTALVLALGAEISPQADSGDIYITSSGDKERTVSAVLTDGEGDGCVTKITIKGKVKFNKDKTDIKTVSDDGRFELSSTDDGKERELKITAGKDGELIREYRVDDKTRPWDEDARKWLAETLGNLKYVESSEDGDFVIITRPQIGTKKRIFVESAPRVSVKVIESDDGDGPVTLRMVTEDRSLVSLDEDGDGAKIVDIYVSGDGEDNGKVWIMSKKGDVLKSGGGNVTLNLSPNGKLIIEMKKDGDKHQLEVEPGKRGEREYIYKVNGEKKPYDSEAQKMFKDYLEILDGGLEIPRGEKI